MYNIIESSYKRLLFKKKGGIKEDKIMKKKVARGAFLLLTLCLSLSTVGCKKSNESNKIKEGQSISSEEKGTSTNKYNI